MPEGGIKMKCPYTIHRHRVVQETYEYDDEGRNKIITVVENNKAMPIECLKEDCGAWKNDHCCYNSNAEQN